jgi:hypothetical protein
MRGYSSCDAPMVEPPKVCASLAHRVDARTPHVGTHPAGRTPGPSVAWEPGAAMWGVLEAPGTTWTIPRFPLSVPGDTPRAVLRDCLASTCVAWPGAPGRVRRASTRIPPTCCPSPPGGRRPRAGATGVLQGVHCRPRSAEVRVSFLSLLAARWQNVR